MEVLDLKRQEPHEFAGKSVGINGCDYTVAANFRTGEQGYAHFLVNQRSGLCLHIMQIRQEYLRDAAGALLASRTKATLTAQLRSKSKLSQPEVAIPYISVHEAANGSFELHEIGWGDWGPGDPMLGMDAINSAGASMRAQDFAAAEAQLQGLLEQHPEHTVALNMLAYCHASRGDMSRAVAIIDQVTAIEPNSMRYRGAQIEIHLNGNGRRMAMMHFARLKAAAPLLQDYDSLGIHAYLVCGAPAEARALLEQAILPEAETQALQRQIDTALATRARFDRELANSLVAQGSFAVSDPPLLAEFERLHASYESDPLIQANLGFVLRRAGEYQRASQLLLRAAGGIAPGIIPVCWANAAFCLIALHEWAQALQLLDATMSILNASGRAIGPADAPGVAYALQGNGALVESTTLRAEDLLSRAIEACDDARRVTPEIRQLLSLYRAFGTMAAEQLKMTPAAPAKAAWWQRLWKR